MYLTYYDESGDDGHPVTSTGLFILSAVYLHHLEWKTAFRTIQDFRRMLVQSHGLPFNEEFHTREFLLNKKPYRHLGISAESRMEILVQYCQVVASLNLRIVNVAINKKAIRMENYKVLDRAFTYSIQRIENDLGKDGSRYLVITDEGRVGKMRSTARRIQRINFVPSRFSTDHYHKEIEHLIEDPLPKNSRESHFIQVADMVSFLVGLHLRTELDHGPLPNRLNGVIDATGVTQCLEILKPSLNLRASPSHPYGVVCYPKE